DADDIRAFGARIVGVSVDTIESHRDFARSHGLTFPLIADLGGALATSYGVSIRGGYADRVTFIIGADGKIARVFPDVRVTGHSDEVLLALGEMTRPASTGPTGQAR